MGDLLVEGTRAVMYTLHVHRRLCLMSIHITDPQCAYLVCKVFPYTHIMM